MDADSIHYYLTSSRPPHENRPRQREKRRTSSRRILLMENTQRRRRARPACVWQGGRQVSPFVRSTRHSIWCATYLDVSRASDSRSVAGGDTLALLRTARVRETAISRSRSHTPGLVRPAGCASRRLPCVTSVFCQLPSTLVLSENSRVVCCPPMVHVAVHRIEDHAE